VLAIMSQTQGLVGERLGSFRLESVVGSGAMGVVYRGINEKNGRPAAVKVVSTEFAQGGKIRDRFEREAEILQQFRHPSIVRFLAVGRFRGTSYIAMEFIPGETLEKVILDRDGMPWREVVDLAIQICDALQYAHEHGVVHRDLKPSNLMINDDGKIKLTDFGIAKDLDATALTAEGRTLGTAAYMSPEQIRGTPAVSHKTDLYAFGVVLYQMLTGKPPFEGATPVVLMHSHLNQPAPRPSSKVHEIPKALDELIVALMAKAPGDRPWDAAAVGVKLAELRDKDARGEPVAMVWPASQPGAAKAAQAASRALQNGAGSSLQPGRKKAKKTGTLFSLSTRDRKEGSGSSWLSRSTIETALLALALVAIGVFIAYRVWPPSAPYLYQQAEALMASSRRADWMTARDDYIKPLDEGFPDHPYREQTRKWLDKILLDDAENRAKVLTSGLKIRMSEPSNNAERQLVIANELAEGASGRHDDLTAIRQWHDFASQVKPEDPDERKWHLYALRQIERLENVIKDRRQSVVKQWELAELAFREGRLVESTDIKNKISEQYSKFTDLADIFPPTPVAPGSDQKPTAAPAVPTPTPDSGGASKAAAPSQPTDGAATPNPADSSSPPEPDSEKAAPPEA
jgi:eukaryotic-like serine/threonine-protein kinase